ncbi:mite allergen Der p 5 [Dermatophagoides farinae]|uniref:5 allergen n=2 Tax=Dermatophagoides farinae TaxID=6954 RepID=A8B8I1_DERFA|nr:mite allergen Der p 5-like [Dermatophagoides farinae]ABO84970.1 group 5 allergen [Dermatophagoides farinae]ABO84974.1 group 5 allergen [Dermatophagoides farinae]ABO84975.1 group 5 allergen [Dermatophagoides farinae]ACK76294.1 Der f 5 allergen [Dermatophagoides farinae]ACK76295.1 Der f 5 allergen [Dermatophagoides farinae]
MKFIIAIAVCTLAVVCVSGEPKKHDYQNEFDFLLMQRIHEQMRKGEEALLHLQHQINTFEENPTKEMKEQILGEMDTIIALIDGVRGVLNRLMKRTDLDIFERYNVEIALKSNEILERDLKKEEQRVKKIEV